MGPLCNGSCETAPCRPKLVDQAATDSPKKASLYAYNRVSFCFMGGSRVPDWLKERYESLANWLNQQWSAITENGPAAISIVRDLPLSNFVANIIFSFLFILLALWIIREFVRARMKLPRGLYRKSPTMVQGRFGLFSIFVVFLLIGIVAFATSLGLIEELQSPWVRVNRSILAEVGLFYICACGLSFFVWSGVSRSEIVVVDSSSISMREMFASTALPNSFLVFIHRVAWWLFIIVFHIASLFVFLVGPRFTKFIPRMDFRPWIRQIKKAGKWKKRTINAGGISGSKALGQSTILRMMNVGHIVVREIDSDEGPMELRYMPRFRELEDALGSITSVGKGSS